jgi:PBP1b-binding outer membrane lipoprotein LpoB
MKRIILLVILMMVLSGCSGITNADWASLSRSMNDLSDSLNNTPSYSMPMPSTTYKSYSKPQSNTKHCGQFSSNMINCW